MSLLIEPTLTTPLLKVPLLLTTAVCTYYGFSPPSGTPDPNAKELERFSVVVPDWLSRTYRFQTPVVELVRVRAHSPTCNRHFPPPRVLWR